jgi:mannose/cellobiose epimerase-like protein (N-acyl-D-glucosamine 2-epimerase family)
MAAAAMHWRTIRIISLRGSSAHIVLGANGIRSKAAINAIFHDGSNCDGNARLWLQTERLKALLLARKLTGDPELAQRAIDAAATLISYLDTPTAGMWYDRRNIDGSFESAPSPASSLYHLVSAIKQLASCEMG